MNAVGAAFTTLWAKTFLYYHNREILTVWDWKDKNLIRNPEERSSTRVALLAAGLEQNTTLHFAASPAKSSVYAGTWVTAAWKRVREGVVFTCRAVLKPPVSRRETFVLFLPPTARYYHISQECEVAEQTEPGSFGKKSSTSTSPQMSTGIKKFISYASKGFKAKPPPVWNQRERLLAASGCAKTQLG